MAPSSNRRSGHSRRAQFNLFTGYVAAIVGALIGAGLLIVSLVQPSIFSGLRGGASDVVEPAGQTTSTARSESLSLWDKISGYLSAGQQNAELREEVELARIRLKEFKAIEQENMRLRALLGQERGGATPVTITRMIGSSATSARRFAYVGAGENDGVKTGMPVHSARGVVGRVLETGRSTSRILLLTDNESILPVRHASKDVVALAQGRGDGLLSIRLINLGINPLEKGDLFVTSGTGGYFRPGIAVAIVSEITSDGALAELVADPATANYVSVEPIWIPETIEAARTPDDEVLGQTAEGQ